ncbi:MAG: excinuclease ABC subunit UvrC [Paludibacteraceae bacterium]|nr:excinuclease ABC subunit UvrC [Paludibacteraceae bacterium]
MNDVLKATIDTLPTSPGVYQYFNREGQIIYVGKAKNLKRRVSSYFNKVHDSVKTNMLVRNIHSMKYIVVNSENEALLLENNLIKKYQPRYNILLKDGKTYPWLCITKEEFPRVFKTRKVDRRGGEYFGPYSSSWTIDTMLELIRELYPIRTCRLPLTRDAVESGKYHVCLQYHIHNCKGVCEQRRSVEDYATMIDEIRAIAKGESHVITRYLLKEMQQLAEEMRFEEAQVLKNKYDALMKYQSKTVIVSTSDSDMDVFAYDEDESIAYVNMLHVSNGAVVQGYTVELHKCLDEPKEELLALAIVELRERLRSFSTMLIVPFLPEMDCTDFEVIIPQRGDKKKLLELSEQNVHQYKADKYKRSEKLNPEQRALKLGKSLQEALHLDKVPHHIECFDNSNISGSDAVAACVVFKHAKPSKKDYRKYIIKTVEGPDDYASMQEVVRRRYTRMMNEEQPLPDLIITDGGRGQMEVVRKVVVDELHLSIPIAGLAKDDHHRTNELLFGFPPVAIGMKPTDTLFRFLTSIQDEVHRFAITFHRDKRSKSQVQSDLDTIAGIGPKTKEALLKHFKSIKRIKEASADELSSLVGASKAKLLLQAFSKDKE